MFKHFVNRCLRRFGCEVVKSPPLSQVEERILNQVTPYTMTNTARILAMMDAVRSVCQNQIPGAIVECGVWRGGSMMAAAAMLLAEGDTNRLLYLFDTFTGMTDPTEADQRVDGVPAHKIHQRVIRQKGAWCQASLPDVQKNLASTGYPMDRIRFIPGKVENTIPLPELSEIALLRLDTDWYTSTAHELKHLFPLLAEGGILIIDDYGYWTGAKRAVDEFLVEQQQYWNFLHRIDYTGRLLIKCRRR